MTTEATVGTSTWVRRFHPAERAAHRLVCFPHAGGAASYYFPVSRTLAPDVDVLAIQYPGRQDRRHEPCIDNIPELADALVEEVLPWFDRPVTFFGHSMGASLAFEVANRLEARGTVLHGLFASGRRAPSTVRDERVHLLDDDGLITDISRLSGTDTQVLGDPEILRMILPAIRADYRAAETYRYTPGPRLSCPLFALTGDQDAQVTVEEAQAWENHTSGPFDLRVFPGGHFYLNDQAAGVMAAIRTHLS
ncbi:thioesterase II family protein [Kitasatospora sp. NBC_01266]|uniref:thioesterase II family protein n=1 Tax=Kitasatospora sp. NBC_01266 TaxID=2903572 RepID=UPI002E346F3E|nr:alpha/beta fold hydrolase [Kitasatospora sp. NBC_01266]